MKTRERLLELIKKCVDDKEFYYPGGKKSLVSEGGGNSYESCYRSCYALSEPKGWNHDELAKIVKELNLDQYKKEIKTGYSVEFNFGEYPSIKMVVKGENYKRTPISHFFIDEIGEVKKVFRETTLQKIGIIEYEVCEITNEYKVIITAGTLTAEISLEEFSAIWNKIMENKNKFPTEICNEKILSRLDQYKLKS